uniref:Indole-3-acetaldehyde oxidase n=2 Tax=Nyssomyia neivai TaxID=330878 RepID=A0A1L8DXU8_9DIPT
MEVAFTINGQPYRVESGKIAANTSLNTFIRSHANLTGTKFMCLEGGCGACIVALKGIHPVTKDMTTWAVNSCLFPVLSCHGLDVITVEGLGDRQKGYHVIQSRLAKMHGTQCGYCSPGMVMNMYSLLESHGGKVTMAEVENSFGGNICRCTGYRPILDAYKSLAVDADPALIEACGDIEDLPKVCPKSGENCNGRCHKTDSLHMNLMDGKEWHKVYSIADALKILDSVGDRSYMIVAGNTAHGVYRRPKEIEIFVDINAVEALRTHSIAQTIDVGANIPLTEFMQVLTEASAKSGFKYAEEMVKHIDLVANVPVRNVGSVAGNLNIKHQHNEFPSDIFLLLVTVGAKFTIRDTKGSDLVVAAEDFLGIDMKKKILTKISLPSLPSDKFEMRSFKITPRAQNAHAYVNAGFLFEFSSGRDKIQSARICYGGINPKFIRATNSEKLLVGADPFTNDTLKMIIGSLKDELSCDSVMPDAAPEYRQKLAIGLFYKAILSFAPDAKVRKEFKSGGSLIERPLSSGKQSFDTYKDNWPLTQPVEKLEALIQCSGEIKYSNDFPQMPNELWAAFVHATDVQSVIKDIDATDALKIPGVVAFFGPKDIPGSNNFSPIALMGGAEEIFCSGKVLFNGQPAGMIVADRFSVAYEAAKLVKITYEKPEGLSDGKIYPTMKDVLAVRDTSRYHMSKVFQKAESRGTEQSKKITGHFEIGSQFHFSMETQTTVAVPNEDCLDIYCSTQWMDLVQMAIAEMLNIPESSINLQVRRLGGGYGSKISRANQVACAAALACHLLNRPVRFVLSIESNMRAVGKRYACANDYEVDVNEHGKVQKLSNEFWHDYGCSLNEEVGGQAAEFFKNAYVSEHWDVKYHAVQTEAPSHTWCRSPGTTEGIAMIENIMEHIAKDLALDPVEVRLANMPDDSPLKGIVKDFVKSVDYYERKKEIETFNSANRWKKRGIAIVPMKYILHYFGAYPAYVAIYHGDGTVAISHGGIEMGQGLNTKVAQIAAHILGIPLESVKVKASNNLIGANALVTGGSQTSEAVGYAVKRACEILLERIRPVREKMKEATWQQIVGKCFGDSIDLTASYLYKKDDLTNYDIWGVSCAEIEIDTLTGMFQLRRVDILEDTGESLSPNVDVGQVEGAFVMGIGYWLHEKLVFNRQNAKLLTDRTWTYKPPGAKDIPVDFRITFLKNASNPLGVLRSKATGEPALCMSIVVLFALRNALDAVRKESGVSDGSYYAMGAPTTSEDILLLSGNSTDQFTL